MAPVRPLAGSHSVGHAIPSPKNRPRPAHDGIDIGPTIHVSLSSKWLQAGFLHRAHNLITLLGKPPLIPASLLTTKPPRHILVSAGPTDYSPTFSHEGTSQSDVSAELTSSCSAVIHAGITRSRFLFVDYCCAVKIWSA